MTSGRKREFNTDEALESAMQVFWQKGYAGASLSDLIGSMGINKPSMYRFFGNKEALFIKTTHRYIETRMQPHMAWLQQTELPLHQRIKKHVMSIVAMQCDPDHAKGCYLVQCQSELVSGNIPPLAAKQLSDIDALPRRLYRTLFSESEEAISLGLDKHAERLSTALYTLLKGTASMARSGTSISQLEYAVDTMLHGIFAH